MKSATRMLRKNGITDPVISQTVHPGRPPAVLRERLAPAAMFMLEMSVLSGL
jgi:hypothetical protein